MNKVTIDDGCFEWNGARHEQGYGQIRLRGKLYRAPRVAYLIYHGHWPKGMVMHTCDNPPCVRKDHLIDGTASQNLSDRARTGFLPHTAKLTREDVKAIRKSSETTTSLMQKYGLSRNAINDARSGRSW